MNADPTSIERIRSATFDTARRGYKKQEVDRFLASLADWLASGQGREQSTAVKEALEEVGRRTGKILSTAEEAAQEIREKAAQARAEADEYSSQKRAQADQQASALKESSEAEAERVRTVTARDAEELTSKAKAAVREIETRGEARKAEIDAEIERLNERRDSIVSRIDELASQLTGAAKEHRPTEASASRAGEKPSEGKPQAAKPARGDGRREPVGAGAKQQR